MKKVLVMSIPHTGTEFVTEYLGFMDIMPLRFVKPMDDQSYSDETIYYSKHKEFVTHPSKHVVSHIHIDHNTKENLCISMKYAIMEYAKENCKVVIPLRHPLENAISYIGRNKETKMSYCENNWNILFDDIIPNYDIFWVDINVAKQKRFKMMEELNKFIGREPIDNLRFRRYVSEWNPVNHVEECDNMKEAYYKHDKLPEGYDFGCLDVAIKWYNNKKVELDELYLHTK